MELKGEYKGYEITASDYRDGFTARIGDSELRSKELTLLIKRIDAIEKKDFQQTNILYDEGWGSHRYRKGVVTSHAGNDEVWIKKEDGGRRKLGRNNIIYDTPENNDKISQILELRKQHSTIGDEIKSIQASLKRYVIEGE